MFQAQVLTTQTSPLALGLCSALSVALPDGIPLLHHNGCGRRSNDLNTVSDDSRRYHILFIQVLLCGPAEQYSAGLFAELEILRRAG